MTRRRIAAGNWKMNGVRAALPEIEAMARGAESLGVEMVICPPATLLGAACTAAASTKLEIGGQDCHEAASGAHTGDISAEMLADAGAAYVILGHSERRADHGETDAMVRAKAKAALAAGLIPIVCVGEIEAERDAGTAPSVVTGQLLGSVPGAAERLVVAYEPVWAIGTGRTPSLADIAEMHGAMRAALRGRFGATGAAVPLLYGGSVKPGNAADIFGVSDVDGGLVGGASLKAADFLAIARALAG